MELGFALDRRAPDSLHRQICAAWRQAILSGRFRPGERVPSTRELAASLGVARGTVTTAFDQLVGEGYLEATIGAGMFVCQQLPEGVAGYGPRRPREVMPIRLSRYGARLAAGVGRPPDRAGTINLSKLSPDVDHFPLGLWRRLLARHLRFSSADVLDYSEHSGGYPPLRDEIAHYVARARGVRCTPDQVIVVNSSQQALDLCGRVLTDPGDEVVFEEPGYDRARELFLAQGARLRPLRVTSDGLSTGDLGRAARLAYVTPSHQFPRGVSLSLTQRLMLIDWAESAGAVLLEDDYDSEFRYGGPPLPAMQSLSDRVPIVYIGTFSKVMFPGLRIGYLVVPPAYVAPFTRAKRLSDRHSTMLEQAALADFLREGYFSRHIRRMRRLYERRRATLLDALERDLPGQAVVHGDAAGLHVLVTFRRQTTGSHAHRRGVALQSSAQYYSSDPPSNEFVLGYSAIDESAIREGVRRLAGR